MTDPRLLVPLSALPDLDPTGLWITDPHDTERRRVCIAFNSHFPDRDTLLDFADAATRDRAARWLGERKGLPAAATAPGWKRHTHPTDPRSYGWLLIGFGSSLFYAHWASNSRQAGHPSIVPELGLLDIDNSRFPDGSFLADALALAAVCRHVGEQP